MFNLIVKAKRDADAVRAALNRFFRDWNIKVYTFKGMVSSDRVFDMLSSIIDDESFFIVLLGRNERHLIALDKLFSDNVSFFIVDKSKVRNARLLEIALSFEYGRAKIRNVVGWNNKSYFFSKSAEKIIFSSHIPAIDVFIGFNGFLRLLESKIGRIGGYPLIIRDYSGLHHIYSGVFKIAELRIPSVGEDFYVDRLSDKCVDVDLNSILKSNVNVIEMYERISLNFLSQFKDAGDIIVPWSGGKDSTCALILALKVFKEDVVPIFVDTGLEFNETWEYIDEISSRLGINVEVEYAPIDRELRIRGLPTLNNRWCTRLKIEALYNRIKKISDNPIVIVGDRDVESRPRSLRPPVRRHRFVLQLAPMKMWPTWLSQLYLIYNNLPLNKLYYYGFYRIGCFICPSLRSWERAIMRRMNIQTPQF